MSVPSDLPTHNQIIQADQLKSQGYLDAIKDWTANQKMVLNKKKTKAMIVNFTDNYQFANRLKIDDEALEVVDHTKLLGVIISNDLKWEMNTEYLVKKANSRMELLRKVATFSKSMEDKKNIYILYIRSILEQSCIVWHSRLTQEDANDLERVQKAAIRIIIGKDFESYEDALLQVDLPPRHQKSTDCLSNP